MFNHLFRRKQSRTFPEPLSQEVLNRIATEYPEEARAEVARMLLRYLQAPVDYGRLRILNEARGDIAALSHLGDLGDGYGQSWFRNDLQTPRPIKQSPEPSAAAEVDVEMDARGPTVRIFFTNLAVLNGGNSQRLPLSELDDRSHIHGGLRIQARGRFLPYLGYFGVDDVCFSTWLVELENISQTFEEKPVVRYTFDEGEQGQPALLFEREEETLYLSVIDSQFSDEGADPQWQRVPCLYHDFQSQYLSMKAAFLSELRGAAPEKYETWLQWALPGFSV